jgi:hypothetical protein
MTGIDTEVTALPTPPVSRGRSVSCPFCHAAIGDTCRTAAGALRDPHRQRWDWVDSLARHHVRVVVIKKDQPELGIRRGEQYLAVRYAFDNEKVTLLRRIPDGYDPSCNQYYSDVQWLRWATAEETAWATKS